MTEPALPDLPDDGGDEIVDGEAIAAEEKAAQLAGAEAAQLAGADEPSADESVPIAPAPDAASQATQQLPKAGARPATAFRRIPSSARRISVVAVALSAVAVGAYLAFSKPPANADAASASAATIPGPMPGAPKTPVHPSTPVSSGDLPISSISPTSRTTPTALHPSNPSQVKTWNSGAAGSALTKVTTLSGNALMANAGQQYTEMLLSCRGLSSAVSSAQQAAPIQDATMQREYAAALSNLKLGAENCMSSIKQVADGVEDTVINVDHTLLSTAVTELSTGASELYVATETLRKQ